MKMYMKFLTAFLMLLLMTPLYAVDKEDHQIKDADFDEYITGPELEKAAHSEDPIAIVLAAKHLAKGEDVLKRKHTSGITAENLLITAYQHAVQNEDKKACSEIRRTARICKRSKIMSEFSTIDKMVKKENWGKDRKLNTKKPFSTGNDKKMESVVQAIVTEAQNDVIQRDLKALTNLETRVRKNEMNLSSVVQTEVLAYLSELKTRVTNNENNRPRTGHIVNYRDGYYSPILRASFVLQNGGARIISIDPYSPLWGRLTQGDVIVRLDGMRIFSYYELERHYGQTTVSFYSVNGFFSTIIVFLGRGVFPVPVPLPDPIPEPMPGPLPNPDIDGPIPAPMPSPMPGPLPSPFPLPTPGSNPLINPAPETPSDGTSGQPADITGPENCF